MPSRLSRTRSFFRAHRSATASAALVVGLLAGTAAGLPTPSTPPPTSDHVSPPAVDPALLTSDRCLACHNGMESSEGEIVSFGVEWRSTMMANSARDPYWRAAVRREVMDHPGAQDEIEAECSRCHLPMAHRTEAARGVSPEVFTHLDPGAELHGLAIDGVSCSVCHRIEDTRLGTESSFTGHFVIDHPTSGEAPAMFGPYDVEEGYAHLMDSAVAHRPQRGDHIRSSELCATCHTLITHSLGPDGEDLGEFPEQVPYQEWLHSDYALPYPAEGTESSEGETGGKSCQSCHMPVVGEAPITSVLGEPRQEPRRHVFRGGNFFMQRMLARWATDLGVTIPPAELELAARKTEEHLGSASAELELERAERVDDRLELHLRIDNLAGHKLPTAYPSRRAWIHLVVRDDEDGILFESGALRPDGSIVGNDNDEDPRRFEPHHRIVERADQVQIYEPILGDPDGVPTTGLLTAVTYLKDNRLLPRGFSKETAGEWIAVHGEATGDDDFTGGGDRIVYRIGLEPGAVPVHVEATLRYQPIGHRWARNLEDYTDAPEPARFVGYYRSMADESSAVLARARADLPR